tara:strand:- start:390 stop:536 length:147 start_codon:yes stop_codon:yes gene_type:complete
VSKTINLSFSGISSNNIERSLPEISFSSETEIANSDKTIAFLFSILKS